MTINPNLTLDPLEIARSFSQSAQTYDQVAVLQREIGNRLLERLEMIRLKPQVIADLGSGTGHFTRLLRQRYRKARVYGFDRAIGMLQFAKQKTHWLSRERFLAADVVALPLQDASVDLAFANLSLHWCPHLPSVFSEIYRVLKPGGFFIFSVMGPDTLKELSQAWQTVDDYPHVNHFLDMHDVGDALLQTNFADPVMDMEYLTMRYGRLSGLIDDLRKLGAHQFAGKRKTLTGKQRFKAMVEAYELLRSEGLLPATYEIIYGHAFRLPKSEGDVNQTASVGVDQIRRLG